MMLKPPIKCCPECAGVHTAVMVCPHCGHRYEPTPRQLDALLILQRRHDDFPTHGNFATVHLGKDDAAMLRKLALLGLVTVTKGGRGTRQFFAITEAGRTKLKEVGR